MDGGGFEWGWEALVAIGTIGLALGTFILAWSTRRAAKASAQDVRAQWRPALAPAEDAKLELREDDDTARLTVRNVGRGAAYYVDAGLDLGETVIPASPWKPELAEPSNLAVLPVGESISLFFDSLDERPKSCAVIVDYEDLNGRPYSTRISINDVQPHYQPGEQWILVVSRVELSDNRELIPWKPPRGRLRFAIFRIREWWRFRKFRKSSSGDDQEVPF